MEYTKGEWMLRKDGMTVETAHAPCGHVIAMMNGIGDKVQADAHLIASAPDLYEALKEAEQHLIMLGAKSDSYARRNIKQALAKAEGK